MITYKLNEAKERVIALVKTHTLGFCSDMMLEVKKAAENGSIDDVEMYTNMIRTSEQISERQIKAVHKAYTIGEILVAIDIDEPGNALFEQEDLVLSTILQTTVKMDWSN